MRIHNFSAGPAVMPEPVLAEARENLLSLGKLGMGVCEISHRSKQFTEIIETAEADLRELLGIPSSHRVLFLQGGATLQFSMVPLNLLGENRTADYIVTGVWSEKAVKEAGKVGEVNIAADSKPTNHNRIPQASEIKLSTDPAYVHFTSNNTIFGTQWAEEPTAADGKLVVDASSDILSRTLDVSKYAIIYAGAQKNLGPSGLAVIIIHDDMVSRSADSLPAYLSYKIHAEKKSMYNTPNTWGVYLVGLTLKWLKSQGGLAVIEKINREKARLIYNLIDASEFFTGHAEKDSRSLMSVTFRLPNEDLEAKFLSEAEAAGLSGLKGHRSVGGLRASIYNACPMRAVQDLVTFLKDFAEKNA
jgi:phosphoserine aminotransferase